jgi:hypothetical protein
VVWSSVADKRVGVFNGGVGDAHRVPIYSSSSPC